LADEFGFLCPQQRFKLIGRRVGKRSCLFGYSQNLSPSGAPEVLDDQISGHAANEPGQLLRLSDVSSPDSFQNEAEGLLVEIVSDGGVADLLANDDPDAAIVTLDQFRLGVPIAGHDPADEINSTDYLFYG